jgi:hypothetical protein
MTKFANSQNCPARHRGGVKSATLSTSSMDRSEDWKRYCAKAMGFEWAERFDDDRTDNTSVTTTGPIPHIIINLLDEHKDEDFILEEDARINTTPSRSSDAWTEMALRIQADLNHMARWIRSKQQDFVDLSTNDAEASLVQTTVASFAATTASELELLQEMIRKTTAKSTNLAHHRSGIVQILLEQLQRDVTLPFGVLQKQRTRMAVELWQNPLQCKLYRPMSRKQGKRNVLFDEDNDDDRQRRNQQFLPKRRQQGMDAMGIDFISKYVSKPSTSIPSNPPDFLVRLSKRQKRMSSFQQRSVEKKSIFNVGNDESQHTSSKTTTTAPSMFNLSPSQPPSVQPLDYQKQLEEDLQEETVQLATALIASSELDSVQQMETRMIEITTLIGQFSNLVQEQQEQVLQVHDSAQETKDNMEKGQANLVDAAERTRRSKHYKAWMIFVMALALLFFHTLRN